MALSIGDAVRETGDMAQVGGARQGIAFDNDTIRVLDFLQRVGLSLRWVAWIQMNDFAARHSSSIRNADGTCHVVARGRHDVARGGHDLICVRLDRGACIMGGS